MQISWQCSRALLPFLLLVGACNKPEPAAAPSPPAVNVMRIATAPVTLFSEYAAQVSAVESIEIRARVGGILQGMAFKEGSTVKKGDLLFMLDQQPFVSALAQAKANQAQAQAAYMNSQRNLTRLQPLMNARAVSQQDFDAAIARERGDAASVEAARAQVQQAQLNLGYTALRAPRAGIISRAQVKPGGLVNAATTLLTTLYSVDPMYVDFTVSEDRLGELQQQISAQAPPQQSAGQAMSYRIKLIDGSDYRYPGTLNFVDAAVDARTGTVAVRVQVPNPEGILRHGQFVRVVAPTARYAAAILVPQQAVQELQGKQSVLVVGADNKLVFRPIVASDRVGNAWLVREGLRAGELIVTEGTGKLQPGMPVQPVIAGQTPAATAAVKA